LTVPAEKRQPGAKPQAERVESYLWGNRN